MAKRTTKRTKVATTAKQSEAERPEAFGAGDFISFVWDWGHPEWLVLAVEAPLEDVTDAYAKLASAAGVSHDLPARLATEKDAERELLVPVVQAKECRWSCILRLWGVPVGEPDWDEGRSMAAKLSAKLKTRAVVFVGEDTSGAMGCFLYAKGKFVKEFDWEDQGDPTEEVFSGWGLYVPPCFPRRSRGKLWAVAPDTSLQRLERVHAVDIGPDL